MDWQTRLKKIQDQRAEPEGEAPKAFIMEVSKVPKPPLPLSAPADNHPGDWRPTFHARLQGDVLMISGVTDDLAGEIIKLTADDLPLQRRLLKLHCGTYSGPWWSRLVERWQERAAIMQYDGGLTREDAEHQAAACLRAEMFIDELRAAP